MKRLFDEPWKPIALGSAVALFGCFLWITYSNADCRSRGGNKVIQGDCYLMILRKID